MTESAGRGRRPLLFPPDTDYEQLDEAKRLFLEQVNNSGWELY